MTVARLMPLRGVLSAFLVLLAVGCVPTEPPPPPFRTAPFGPGLETDLPGERVIVEDGDGARVAKLRVGRHALRIYDGDGVREATVAKRPDGLKISARDGTEICTVVEEAPDGWAVICGSVPEIRLEHDAGRWTFLAADGRRVQVETVAEPIRVSGLGDDEVWNVENLESGAELRSDAGDVRARLNGFRRLPIKERALLLVAAIASDAPSTDGPADADADGVTRRSVSRVAWLAAAWLGTHGSSREEPRDVDDSTGQEVPIADPSTESAPSDPRGQ